MNPSELKNRFFDISRKTIHRDGIEPLLNWLENYSDFFIAPASTKNHLAYPGGLCEHSLNVAHILDQLVHKYNVTFPLESVYIIGLFHDLCKIDTYVIEENPPSDAMLKYMVGMAKDQNVEITHPMRNNYYNCKNMIDFLKSGCKGEFPKIQEYPYKVKDTFPLGHGEKSNYLIQLYMKLNREEALAIRWHVGSWDHGVTHWPSKYPFDDATNKYPIVGLTMLADYEASVMEKFNLKEY